MRWQALALIGVVLLVMGAWWLALRRARAVPGAEDLFLVILGIVPGALIGGRLFHVIVFAEAYLARPGAVFDLAQGSLSLSGAVLGGVISGGYVCRLMGHSIGRWLDAAAAPLLLGIGLGKVAMLLGGGGQGLPFEGPWAVALLGPGPWSSADASIPAHPSQVYEGVWALAGILLLLRLRGVSPSGPPGGRPSGLPRLFVAAVGWWLAGRFLVGFTWRDDRVLVGLHPEQLLSVAGLALLLGMLLRRRPMVTPS